MLNDIIKTVVWNLSSNCAKSYLRDMSQQVINLLHLGPIVVAQKRGGGQEFRPLMLKKTGSLQSNIHMIRVINTLRDMLLVNLDHSKNMLQNESDSLEFP